MRTCRTALRPCLLCSLLLFVCNAALADPQRAHKTVINQAQKEVKTAQHKGADRQGEDARRKRILQGKLSIVVQMTGFNNDKGLALVSLHRDAKSFPSHKRGHRVQQVFIKNGRALARFEALEPGTYAIAVLHDENLDGELGFAWLPFPHITEQAGMSHNEHPDFGPPSFTKAKFILKDQDLTVNIRMQL